MGRQHRHLIIRAIVNKPATSVEELSNWLKTLVSKVGMNILNGPHIVRSDLENNEGYTGIVVLDWSHAAIHFWDKDNLAEIDLFSCKEFSINDVVEFVKQSFGIRAMNIQYINRDEKFGESENVYVVYKTTNLINNKFYIGIHGFVDLNDGYLGSSVQLQSDIKQFGRENFKCEYLKFFNRLDEALSYEKELVTWDLVKTPDSYNKTVGGALMPNIKGSKLPENHKNKIKNGCVKFAQEYPETFAKNILKASQAGNRKRWGKSK